VLPIGVVVNPLSGKDIRRLSGKASVFDNREKEAIVRRAVAGAVAAGARKFAYMDDSHGIAASGFYDVEGIDVVSVECPRSATMYDTIESAFLLSELNCAAVLVLGGDGTNRAFVKGWREAVMMPLSTGTNNVFPVLAEATVAGSALGLIGSGKLNVSEVSRVSKIIDIEIEGEASDIALIDAVMTDYDFVGSKALLDADAIQQVLLTRADPAAVGMTSLGGLIQPVDEDDDSGLFLEMGEGGIRLNAPLAPGLFAPICIKRINRIPFDKIIELTGPGVLALDGERERIIEPGQKIELRVSRSGPRVLDINIAMKAAASGGLLRL
jgi:hypothetical protein